MNKGNNNNRSERNDCFADKRMSAVNDNKGVTATSTKKCPQRSDYSVDKYFIFAARAEPYESWQVSGMEGSEPSYASHRT